MTEEPQPLKEITNTDVRGNIFRWDLRKEMLTPHGLREFKEYTPKMARRHAPKEQVVFVLGRSYVLAWLRAKVVHPLELPVNELIELVKEACGKN